MAEVKMPHPHHEEHLCMLQNIGFVEKNLEEYKKLVKQPKYVCKGCGRVAENEKNLCSPEKL
jgi:rRNA maturation endonuclease Nob1